jgi:hypothetical protein
VDTERTDALTCSNGKQARATCSPVQVRLSHRGKRPLHVAPPQFDGMELGTVGRQVDRRRSSSLDGGADGHHLMVLRLSITTTSRA